MVEECLDVVEQWPVDGAAFLIGCSFTFDALLQPYLTPFSAKCESVPMYRTNIATANAGGVFNQSSGMVCSMRFVPEQHVQRVIELTKQVPLAHGAPIAVGTRAAREIGITNILKPDFGLAPQEEEGVPVFWPCGVTPQVAIERAKLNAITHSPGCMFVTDVDVKDIIII